MPLGLKGYSDSDFASGIDKRRSPTGYVFLFEGNVVSWKSSLQTVVALFTTKSELIALSKATKEAIWLKGIIEELGYQQDKVNILYCGNKSTIHLAHNQQYHEI